MCCILNFFVFFIKISKKLGDVVVLFVYVLQLHQVSLNSDEKQKKNVILHRTHLGNRRVRPLEAGESGLFVIF